MSREIRITIDDDEVFERMRRRKGELDLSWEEVLRRGLGGGRSARWPPGPWSRQAGHHDHFDPPNAPEPSDPDFEERIRRSVEKRIPGRGSADAERGDRPGPLGSDFDQWVGERVEDTVRAAMSAATRSLDVEIDRLEGAEDATLVFDSLDEPREVPLRIDLRAGPAGLDVDVIAVRQGKGTEGQNEFTESERKAIARHLAGGGTASLRIGDDGVTYDSYPSLAWGRDVEGNPTVTDVEIVDVDLD